MQPNIAPNTKKGRQKPELRNPQKLKNTNPGTRHNPTPPGAHTRAGPCCSFGAQAINH